MQSKRKNTRRRNRRHQKSKRRGSSKNYVFKSSSVPPKRSVLYGGDTYGATEFPASFTSATPIHPSVYPTSYAGDPNYLAVGSRTIGGKRQRKSSRKQRGGGDMWSAFTSNIFTSQPQMVNNFDKIITTTDGVKSVSNAIMGRTISFNGVTNTPLA